jgi:hypothetical protein
MQAEQKQCLVPNNQINTGNLLDVRLRQGSQTLKVSVKGVLQDDISDKQSMTAGKWI